MKQICFFYGLVLCMVGVHVVHIDAVDLYVSNMTDRDILATARTCELPTCDIKKLSPIKAGSKNVFVENITPRDTLFIYWASGNGKSEPVLWGKFLITLGGQREEEIRVTVAGDACKGFRLQDILHEPGEGGYDIQDLYKKENLAQECPFK